MWQARMQKLIRLLREENDFGTIWNYFMDEFGENPEFMQLGTPYSSPVLEVVVAKLCDAYYPGAPVLNLSPIRVAECGLIHGGFQVRGCMGVVFYSEEISTGLVAVGDLPPSHTVHYGRFRDVPLDTSAVENHPQKPPKRPLPKRSKWKPSRN